MSDRTALIGAEIFDGVQTFKDHAVLVQNTRIESIVPEDAVPDSYQKYPLEEGFLVPGFIDLQVNGGGGVMFNGAPTPETISTICEAHLPFGTTALLPTLITDTPDITKQALEAGFKAAGKKQPGFLGLHLEGPHLAASRKGAHRDDLIRPMSDADLDQLIAARSNLPHLMVTVAPESVGNDEIMALADAGIVVSLGHSDATCESGREAFSAGAKCSTHLYNAMSGLSHREPGLVGATLTSDEAFAGLIADGHHVVLEAITVAMRAKSGKGKLFLVSDAMALTGTDATQFMLNGREIIRSDGRLTLADGTLAGADLEMHRAVKFMAKEFPLEQVLPMASLYPAQCIEDTKNRGMIAPGLVADIVHLDRGLNVENVWRAGVRAA